MGLWTIERNSRRVVGSSRKPPSIRLVIMVTPHLVTGSGPTPRDPLADSAEPSAIDVILQGLVPEAPKSPAAPQVKG